MRHSWRIGKIFGIDIYIDSSWFVIFILFSWVLAANYFPHKYADWSPSIYWVVGITTSLLIFASVLVHEVAHSLVALRQGEKVRSITLFILGGVAQITEEPKNPIREFTMALIGPLTSLMVGIIFFVFAILTRGVNVQVSASASYLGLINVALAIFNLLPGFPMDGGRVLRSIIWQITGNLRKATNIASKTGQGFAFFLMFIGILQTFRGNLSGLWLIFVGWFLHSAAVRGYHRVIVEAMLKGVSAEDLMSRDFETVSGEIKVQELVDNHILKKKERVFFVVDKDNIQGIVCLDDVKAIPRREWPFKRVADIMTPREKLLFVSPQADGNKILNSITAKDIHQVPVIEGNKILGIICRTDILRFIQLRSELGV